jgi:S-adenosylmethionine/arginine decarboxylase-like enzyme|tara:strand:+ start:9753 stop:10112 length:360 start_codon:yes stop_codon:yes gene_type:complete
MTWWGSELTLDCGKCDPLLIKDAEHIKAFARDLVVAIDMKAFGDPIVIHFGTEDKMGYTLVQLIETSNITAHFSEDTGSAFINVFSCRTFDKQVVSKVVLKYFKPRLITMKMTDRLIPI